MKATDCRWAWDAAHRARHGCIDSDNLPECVGCGSLVDPRVPGHVCPLTAEVEAIAVLRPLSCSECGEEGTYYLSLEPFSWVMCVNPGCLHTAGRGDFDLDPGESLEFVNGVLHVAIPA